MNADMLAPHNIESEQHVLGGVLMSNGENFLDLDLKVEDFYLHRHAIIWAAMARLFERGEVIDYLTLTNELDAHDQLDDVGGAGDVLKLVQLQTSTLNVEGWAKIVRHMATRRRLLDIASKVARLAHSEDTPISEVVDRAQSLVLDVDAADDTAPSPLGSVVSGHMDGVMERYKSKNPVSGVKTGYSDLDAKLSGLQRGALVIAAARPGNGKTSLLCEFTRNMTDPVLYVTLEMTDQQIVNRMAAAEAQVSVHRLKSGTLTDEQFQRYVDAATRIEAKPHHILDAPVLTTGALNRVVRRYAHQYGVKVVMVDYLQLLSADTQHASEVQRIGAITRALKGIALAYDVAVVVASQLNRGVEMRPDKRPLLSDLRDSGRIEEDADVVLMLYREAYYQENNTQPNQPLKVIVRKHRDGAGGDIDFIFQPEYCRIVQAAKGENWINFDEA